MNDLADEKMSSAEIRSWIEFGAWCTFSMTPIVWWLQGPSVSDDQFYMRVGLVVLSLVISLGMRIYAMMDRKNAQARQTNVS